MTPATMPDALWCRLFAEWVVEKSRLTPAIFWRQNVEKKLARSLADGQIRTEIEDRWLVRLHILQVPAIDGTAYEAFDVERRR